MNTLFANLGLDWKLLLSQAANFIIVLVVLRLTVYKPLLAMLHARRKRIEEGLEKADEADKRLGEITEMQRQKMKEAEAKGVELVTSAQERAKAEEQKMMTAAALKEQEMMARAHEKMKTMEKEAREQMEAEAARLVKQVLVKVVSIAPENVDDALIAKALKKQ